MTSPALNEDSLMRRSVLLFFFLLQFNFVRKMGLAKKKRVFRLLT